jgi:hypothetical protein
MSNTYACSMGFSIIFKEIEEGNTYSNHDTNIIDNFLNKKYGANKWELAEEEFYIKAPEIAENPTIIPVTIGAENAEYAGKFSEIKWFNIESIKVLDTKRYENSYLPRVYHVDDLSKNSSNALNFNEITYKEKRINNVASFKLSGSSIPYISMRLNLSGASYSQLFAAFIPYNSKEKIIVVKQKKEINTPGLCSSTYYIRGEWPKGIRSEHRYE